MSRFRHAFVAVLATVSAVVAPAAPGHAAPEPAAAPAPRPASAGIEQPAGRAGTPRMADNCADLRSRAAALITAGYKAAVCIDPEAAPKPGTGKGSASARMAELVADDEALEHCRRNRNAWWAWRGEACLLMGFRAVQKDLRTLATIGWADYDLSQYITTTTSGDTRWHDITVVSRTAFWQTGAQAVHVVNVSCVGDCYAFSRDPAAPVPTAGGLASVDQTYLQSSIRGSTNRVSAGGRTEAYVTVTAPGAIPATAAFYNLERPPPANPVETVRCDTYLTKFHNLPGCVYPSFAPTATFDYDDNDFWEVSQHIKDSQRQGSPGAPGSGRPLHRTFDEQTINDKYAASCPASFPRGPGQSCDEYPFKTTREGAASGGPYTARAVTATHNSDHGNALNTSFYVPNRVFDGDAFWVRITDPPAKPKIMVLGDSISQGLEGAYTWRYRLKNHLTSAGADVDFVGPYVGTTRLPDALPAGFPQVSPPVYFHAAYRDNLRFDSEHFAHWGRQAHQSKDDINRRIQQFRPDYLLVELGFNDLGWGVSDPDGLIADMRQLIANARAARSDLRILVANVVHRTPIPAAPDLNQKITDYNGRLGAALASVNTAASPVRLVDIDNGYDPAADAYDGLHPNGRGEFKLARAFANVLASSPFNLGATFGSIPASVPDLTPDEPWSIGASAVDAGIRVFWSHSFGAEGYWLYQRDATANQP
ncbi:GDSL-type esterase/lipase family protein, partial [Actinoplanes sp. NPDC051633]|uniref:GDSL-type esterase/lipase family protein n=1 Tax=Actinoplanes sp. NPDC051633 TaxID=3155670 RepID=UPI00342501A6